ncbi:hypothetical protein [Acanthopleuribacter pedis]|uniref:Uncharacterized protein n=1 Tax=Acanthopleuribacter pedis TaxID=442870 RepID=A0A8J7QGP9_9BACT|nr:hypothetical protein [Acanthopleuribacter pedis]MBO1320036.1 hypothetical protein [Acanthopleuribacter pedis]
MSMLHAIVTTLQVPGMFFQACHLPISAILALIAFSSTSQNSITRAPETAEEPPQITVLMGPRDSTALFLTVANFWQSNSPNLAFPKIITPLPGPIETSSGLRLVANEFPPNWTLPDLLIISGYGNWELTPAIQALVRRMINEEKEILVVGDQLPPQLRDLDLHQGFSIPLIKHEQLTTYLQRHLH